MTEKAGVSAVVRSGRSLAPLNRNQALLIIIGILVLSFSSDIVNGLLGTAETSLTFGKLARGLILVSCLLYLACSNRTENTFSALALVGTFFLLFLVGALRNTGVDLGLEAVQLARILYTPVLALFLVTFLRRFYNDTPLAKQVIVHSCHVGLLIVASVALPRVFGFGYVTYEVGESFGGTGILLSQNEIALTLILLQVFAAYVIYQISVKHGIFLIVAFGIALILIGTRAALLGSFVVPVVAFGGLILMDAIGQKGVAKGSFRTLFVVAAAGIVAGLVMVPIVLRDQYLMAKFVSLLVSLNVREGLTDAGLTAILDGSLSELVFGQTATTFYDSVAGSELVVVRNDFGKRVEVDWIDIAGIYGVLGVTIAYGFYLGMLFRSGRRLNSSICVLSFMCLSLFCLHSIWAGHAFFAPMPGSVVAIAIALAGFDRSSVYLLRNANQDTTDVGTVRSFEPAAALVKSRALH